MSLFNFGEHFSLHSGRTSQFKIDCSVLLSRDLDALISLVINKIPPFRIVLGIPTGGTKLAAMLDKYTTPEANTILIVDDVLTTGNSMTEAMEDIRKETGYKYEAVGLVMFARGECPDWITPIFQLNENFSNL